MFSQKQVFLSKFLGNKANVFMVILTFALLSFEVFNFSTTQYTFQTLLGDLSFGPMAWSTLLAVAFCGIDFAGVAKLFTPEQGSDEPAEVWYLFGAWLLAACMNSFLTWWGVREAIATRSTSTMITADQQNMVAIFVAFLVLMIRVLLIATFAIKGDALFNSKGSPAQPYKPPRPAVEQSRPTQQNNGYRPVQPAQSRPQMPPAQAAAYKPVHRPNNDWKKDEPTYKNLQRNDLE